MANRIFPKKYSKKITEADAEFLDNVMGLDTDDIKKKILECEGHIYEIENAKDADEELVKTREKMKEMTAPYRETKTLETAKLKYMLFILEERGIEL
jgi:hypothetical protein